jgi:nucleoside-diphosphate-sugar epimerase
MKIAFLGGSSQIAKDLLLRFNKSKSASIDLYCRDVVSLRSWMDIQDINFEVEILDLRFFSTLISYDAVINFIGSGDPSKTFSMGRSIVEVTEYYDLMVLDYLKVHKTCKYIFFSSGAIFGGNYFYPVSAKTKSNININDIADVDWYGLAKLMAELRHRLMKESSIVDLRIFNYFSRSQDLDASYFISQIINCILDGRTLSTSNDNIARDYLNPEDLFSLINILINEKRHLNTSIDVYSLAPIAKFELLDAMSHYGLNYEVKKNVDQIVNATGVKYKYFSKNKFAAKFGYKPKYSSISGIKKELSEILSGIKKREI